MGWSFQYWTGSTWATLANAALDHILEELNGTEEVMFNLPNTAANRAIIASNVSVNVLYNSSIIFAGFLTGAKYTAANLQCYVYNPVFVALKQGTATLTKAYSNVAANSILADIVALTSGVSVGSCPTTGVSIKFTNANAFDALASLAKALGLYYWGASGAINIGTRDTTTYTPTVFETGTSSGVDRSKQYGTVIIKGVDINGVQIQGNAGSGGAVKTFTDKKASDVGTLNSLAAYKLLTLNNPSTGNPLSILTDTAAGWHPGQYVTVSRADLNLSGTFMIQRVTKGSVLSTVEVDIPVMQEDINLQDTSQYADLGTYPVQPTTQTPQAVVTQCLYGLYHTNDGAINPSATSAKDDNPNGYGPNNGVITGGTWINGAIQGTKVLQLYLGNIDCGASFDPAGLTAFAVGLWYSPYEIAGKLISKAGQFELGLTATNSIYFTVITANGTVTVTAPNNSVAVNGRCFALAVYDGANLYLYVSDTSGIYQIFKYSQAQTGSVVSGSANTFIGANPYNGIVAEIMLWTRALSAQEAQQLYFFPLFRVSGPGAASKPVLPPTYGGILSFREDKQGTFEPEQISETATVSNSPGSSESISESVTLTAT